MDLINQIFWTVVLVGVVLAALGSLAGIKADQLVRTYVNLVVQVVCVIGDILVKLSIPLLKDVGEKIVYVTQHYLNEHKEEGKEKGLNVNAAQPTPQAKAEAEPARETNDPGSQKKEAATNPYDEPPRPDIMD